MGTLKTETGFLPHEIPEPDIRIRFANTDDAAAILAVYTPYIKDTPITFETTTPSLDEFTTRIADTMAIYPYLVAEESGFILGFAYAHRYHERSAFDWNAEASIYLNQTYTGKGVGRRLYETLLSMLEAQGVRNVLGSVALPNVKSERLHHSLGFQHTGTQRQSGFKCGAWHDVGWFQKQIGDFEGAPQPITPLNKLDPVVLAALIHAANNPAAFWQEGKLDASLRLNDDKSSIFTRLNCLR